MGRAGRAPRRHLAELGRGGPAAERGRGAPDGRHRSARAGHHPRVRRSSRRWRSGRTPASPRRTCSAAQRSSRPASWVWTIGSARSPRASRPRWFSSVPTGSTTSATPRRSRPCSSGAVLRRRRPRCHACRSQGDRRVVSFMKSAGVDRAADRSSGLSWHRPTTDEVAQVRVSTESHRVASMSLRAPRDRAWYHPDSLICPEMTARSTITPNASPAGGSPRITRP